ncbi:MAG: Ig-like domain-containing protein [Pseudomonadota bacterium]
MGTKQLLTKVLLALPIAFCIVLAGDAQDISNNNLDADNRKKRDEIVGVLAAHNAAWGAALSPDPIFGFLAGSGAYSYNIALKYMRPVLQQSDDMAVRPNMNNGCRYGFTVTHHSDALYSDYLGLGPLFPPGGPRLDQDWGFIGGATVYHGNTELKLETTLNGDPFGIRPGSSQSSRSVFVPIGGHTIDYRAAPQISTFSDLVPWHTLGLFASKEKAKQSIAAAVFKAVLQDAAVDNIPGFIAKLLDSQGLPNGALLPRDVKEAVEVRGQRFFVLDEVHPTLNVLQPVVDLEAIAVGGRVLDGQLEIFLRNNTLEFSDNCLPDPLRPRDKLTVRLLDPPRFLPVGQDIEITWRLFDNGPSSLNRQPFDPDFPEEMRTDDRLNEVRATQVLRIRDTLAPVIKPPSGRVIESTAASENVALGMPAVFDLADPEADIVGFVDGQPVGSSLNLNVPSRTAVTWTATDASGNEDSKTQWVTVKPQGSNTAPTAVNTNASAISFEPMEIEIFGEDQDLIDGRYDQLSFAITDEPDHGNFVAPLFPFFIEDFRVEANLPEDIQAMGDTDGDGLINPLELREIWRDWCGDPVQRQIPIPRDLITEPLYVEVADDGSMLVSDLLVRCRVTDPDRETRIARFGASGELEAEYRGHPDAEIESFFIAPNGRLYFVDQRQPNRVHEVDLTPIDEGFGEIPFLQSPQSYRLLRTNNNSEFDIKSVTVDSNNILYAASPTEVFAYDLNQVDSGEPLPIGELVPIRNSSGGGFDSAVTDSRNTIDMTVDAEDNVYITDDKAHRVYKYAPSGYDRQTNQFTPGELVGWMGRCTSNRTTTPACDVVNQRSYGFTCTTELCGEDLGSRNVNAERNVCELEPVGESRNLTSGCRPGQFDTPRGIAVAPNDTLYVADTFNNRIQRFSSEGFLGGEARSECDGSCFVLGDFGRPQDVSVNGDAFFVLDTEFELLHIFQTTPITNVDEANMNIRQNAFVTYVSENNFRGTDSFGFTTSDGLDESAPATVNINVSRNFRPPVANDLAVQTSEDTALPITLVASDPDEDELSYIITEPPQFGELQGTGPDFTYVPNVNFAGSDQFSFVVDDAPTSSPNTQSEPALVNITITPVPDSPDLSLGLQNQTTKGFNTPIRIESIDPDEGDKPIIIVDWGDGTIQMATEDLQNPGARPIMVATNSGLASIQGQHQYTTNGDYTVTVCAAEEPATEPFPGPCGISNAVTIASKSVTIMDMADIAVFVDDDQPKVTGQCPMELDPNDCPLVSDDLRPGDDIVYTINIEHVALPGGIGLASDITGLVNLPSELLPTAAAFSGAPTGTVTQIDGNQVTFNITELAAGEKLELEVTAVSDSNISENTTVSLAGMFSSSLPDPSGMNLIGFTTTIAVDPNADADGDGVPNGEDAFPNDPNESQDSDNDGVGNNRDPDDDNDGMGDYWEERFGLDGLNNADVSLDSDGDGLLNGDEFGLGTRPNIADTDGDGILDGDDNCVINANQNQLDLNMDGIGDACDPTLFVASSRAVCTAAGTPVLHSILGCPCHKPTVW